MKKTILKWSIFIFCLIAFLVLAISAFTSQIMQSDIIGYNLVSTYLIKDSLTPFVKIITWFGSATCLIILTCISFITIKNRRIDYLIIVNLSLITIFNQILKFIVHRNRPTGYCLINESGYSFPSGHSMVSMAFYGLLIYLIYTNIKNKYLKSFLITFLTILVIAIGISRIYLGVHYTSDVCAGFLLSIAYLIIYIKLTKKFLLKKSGE